jgi:hypothetical protein
MKVTIKRIAIGFAPAMLGFACFFVYQTTIGYTSGAIALISFLGPFLIISQQLSIVGFVLCLLLTTALVIPHIVWQRWYTAILALIGGYIWCFIGLVAAGASA